MTGADYVNVIFPQNVPRVVILVPIMVVIHSASPQDVKLVVSTILANAQVSRYFDHEHILIEFL